MSLDQSAFRRQLRQFRILTVIGYGMLLLLVGGAIAAGHVFAEAKLSEPVALPIVLVCLVLHLAVVMPFILVAYDKTICPHCGKRIEEGNWVWHGIRFNGPTRRYWKLFWGRPLKCPHCGREVIASDGN